MPDNLPDIPKAMRTVYQNSFNASNLDERFAFKQSFSPHWRVLFFAFIASSPDSYWIFNATVSSLRAIMWMNSLVGDSLFEAMTVQKLEVGTGDIINLLRKWALVIFHSLCDHFREAMRGSAVAWTGELNLSPWDLKLCKAFACWVELF